MRLPATLRLLALSALLLAAPLHAAEIRNFDARQTGSDVVFTFDVQSDAPEVDVSLLPEVRGEAMSPGRLSLEGDAGLGVPGQGRKIVWKAGQDFPEGYSGPLSGEISAVDVVRDGITGMKFSRVRGGAFEMGCGPGNPVCDEDELPVHRRRVEDFYMGRKEVTKAQFALFLNDTGSGIAVPGLESVGGRYVPAAGEEDSPVRGVSWHDARAFADWLSLKSGHRYSLPSEAQWEYACRSGGRFYAYGTATGQLPGNLSPEAVLEGGLPPNLLGLSDMSGGLWEWVGDSYASYDGKASDGSLRVLRGGRDGSQARHARCANRYPNDPAVRSGNAGFRLVRE